MGDLLQSEQNDKHGNLFLWEHLTKKSALDLRWDLTEVLELSEDEGMGVGVSQAEGAALAKACRGRSPTIVSEPSSPSLNHFDLCLSGPGPW